ncbi:hypothetical protein mRhiFer1_000550 [Rhinolophus ferrumequinum]|uniref:Uncharacterized protein n=1 Tax=Rhinolophus ferrumequinum TaxID=59479 RepID=A0A7J7ZQD2_RHIFE|nr:hypothetical protein mRhiFer1_000550 [Rhinolophus ferrumequinum]
MTELSEPPTIGPGETAKYVDPPKELLIGRGETHEQVKFSVNCATVGVCTSFERTSGDGIPSLIYPPRNCMSGRLILSSLPWSPGCSLQPWGSVSSALVI